MIEPADLLHTHNLKRTSCREGIVAAMLVASRPLSEADIRDSLSGNYDRTTFYRTFKTLLENKIIHKIVVDNQVVRYALDKAVSKIEDHAHFYCETCQGVFCMETVQPGIPDLPKGFMAKFTELIVKGFCDKCQEEPVSGLNNK